MLYNFVFITTFSKWILESILNANAHKKFDHNKGNLNTKLYILLITQKNFPGRKYQNNFAVAGGEHLLGKIYINGYI